jgi:hypothetical protein
MISLFFKDPKTLAEMITKVFKLRLEGLVLKSVDVSQGNLGRGGGSNKKQIKNK